MVLDQSEAVLGLIQDMKATCNPNMVPALHKIEEGIERLTTEISVLRMIEPVAPNIDLRREYKIPPKAALLLAMLQSAGTDGLANERILASIYSGSGRSWPQRNIIKVWITHIRSALKRENAPFSIETIWGHGYRIVDGVAERTNGQL